MYGVIHVPCLSPVSALLDIWEQPHVFAYFRLRELYAVIDGIDVFRPKNAHNLQNIRWICDERIATYGRLLDNRELPPIDKQKSLKASEDAYLARCFFLPVSDFVRFCNITTSNENVEFCGP